MAKKGSACAKLIIFAATVLACILTLASVVDLSGASNSGVFKCAVEAGDQSIQKKDRECDKSKLGATWITGTCESGTSYKLSLWEVCVTKASATSCYDFDDTSQATIATALPGASASLKTDMATASKAVIVALAVSFVLLLWGCAVIVNDDLSLNVCNRVFFTLLGLGLMACQAIAVHLVQTGLNSGGCSADKLGDGGNATAASLGFTALVVLITFPLDCGPCGACIEGGSGGGGGDKEEEEDDDGDSGGAAAAACCLVACVKTVFCVWLTIATEKAAQVVGIAYTVTRTVVSKLSTLVCPILCLPLFLCAKLTPKKHHPTKCAKRLSLLSCWASLGLVLAAFFASEQGTTNYAPQPDAGWFGTPIVKAECNGRTLIGTLFEACWSDGAQNSNGVICKDYADDVTASTTAYATYFKDNTMAEVLGKEGLRLAIAIIVLQLVMAVSVSAMFFCVLMRNLPGPGYFVGVVGGISSTLQVAFLAIVHRDLIASTSAYQCGASASPSPSDGMVFLSISCVLNVIVAIMLFGPFLKFVFSCCPCCKDGGPCDCCDAADDDGEDDGAGDELAPTSKKHVI